MTFRGIRPVPAKWGTEALPALATAVTMPRLLRKISHHDRAASPEPNGNCTAAEGVAPFTGNRLQPSASLTSRKSMRMVPLHLLLPVLATPTRQPSGVAFV